MVLVEFDKAYKSLWSPFSHLRLTWKVNDILLSYWKRMKKDFMMNVNEMVFHVYPLS